LVSAAAWSRLGVLIGFRWSIKRFCGEELAPSRGLPRAFFRVEGSSGPASSPGRFKLNGMPGGSGPLARPGFRRLWLGQTASLIGDSVFFLIFFYMVDQSAEGDAVVVSLVTALMSLPFVLFGAAAGRAADRLDRRAIMVASDIGSTVLMAAAGVWSFFEPVPPWPLLAAVGFGVGAANSFFLPARLAAIPRLVPEREVARANGLFLTTGQIAYMAGLSLSAVGLGALEKLAPEFFFSTACLANAATFLVSAVIVGGLPRLRPLQEPEPSRFWKDVAEGLRAVRKDRLVFVALITNAVISLCISGFFVAYLQVNREWFSGTFRSLAGIELAFALTSAFVGVFVGRLRIRRPGIAFMSGSIVIGASVAVMAYSRDYWAFVAANILAGLAFPFLIVPLTTYIQLAYEDSLRGRVNSAWTVSQEAVKPAGLVLTGAALTGAGLPATLAGMGIGMSAAGLAGLCSPSVRRTLMPESDAVPPVNAVS
jgi:MFS family permease